MACYNNNYLQYLKLNMNLLVDVEVGDIIDGRVFKDLPRNSWREAFMDIVKPINDTKTPWTFVPGNHDDDHSPWSRSDLLQIYQLEGCISKETKTFDHTMSIGFESGGESARLWLFDSGGNNIKNPELRYESFKCVDSFSTMTKNIVFLNLLRVFKFF